MRDKLFTRNFTFLILGQVSSLIGNYTLKFALSMYVLEQTGSASIFATLLAVAMLPTILLSPFGGILADRANRRNIMVGLDTLSGCTVLVAGLVLPFGHDIWVIGALLVILSVLAAFESPTVQACIPQMLSGDNLMKGNAAVNQVQAIAGLITPFLGSLVYAAFGLTPVLWGTVACFFLTAILECFIHLDYQKAEVTMSVREIIREDFSVSIHFLRREQPCILKLLLLAALASLFVAGTVVVGFPYLVRTVLGLSAEHYGAAESVMGVAAVLGSLFVVITAQKFRLRWLAFVFMGLGLSLIPTGIAFLLPIGSLGIYIKDPDNPKRWIVEDEAAQVVRRIYSMTLEGYGTEQIATQLERDEILTPRAYWLKKGIKRPGKGKQQPATKWNSSTVTKILSLQEYCGDILNFKTYSKSYKNKKRLENDRENWVVFKDVHEPIIERSVFEQVQQKRGKIRKRRTNKGEHNMFSGLLVCADCGCTLHFHFNQGNPEIKYFNCSNYKGNRGSCTSTHYVRVDFLEQVVLGEIRRLTKFASLYEDEFLKAVIGHSQQAAETDRKLKEKELKALLARDEELDGLFERIYEDNVSGKLSDDRFAKMSRRYEDEQKELAEKIKKLRSEIEKQSSQAMTTDMFISLVRKYTRARKLKPRMLNELVEKIEVYHAEKIDGVWEQRLRIHYNCVGEITIPKMLPLPIPDVTVNTRKGVFVNYAPAEIAG